MLSTGNHQPSIAEVLSGNFTKWYNDVDECLKVSEVVPGQYEYTTATSYGNVGQIEEGASTFVDIQAERFKLISVDNSYIYLEQTIPITIPAQTGVANHPNAGIYYIGHLMSAAAIGQFRIYSNTDLIQTVNHANYEWFLEYNSTPDDAKENSPDFATIKKIREMNPNVPGTYIDVHALTAAKVVNVPIKLRIPLNRFLLLKNIKWLPQWMGKVTIEIIPTYKNLVIAPVLCNPLPDTLIAKCEATPAVNLGFYNINQPMMNCIKTTAEAWKIGGSGTPSTGTVVTLTPATHDISAQTFTANTQTSDHISIRCATYMIQMDVFNSLVEKYISVPLLFPVQIIQSKDFTTSIGTSDIVDTAMTVALQHCDASYTVFKKDINSTMCFENPAMTYQFNIDGKYYPREAYNSINDIRSVNHTLDALNVNDSDVTSIHEDLRTSLQPYSWIQTSNAEGKLTAGKRNTTGTKSNFFIGIPFCDSEDFMGGISTNGTVQIQLRGQRLTEADGALVEKEQFAQPATIFTEDSIMKIRATKPAGRPQIEITKASIEQLMGSGV